MDKSYRVDDVTVLPGHIEAPGVGVLPVNSFVIHAAQPALIDAGMAVDRDAFLGALRAAIDPKDLQWIWLTHDDSDHAANVEAVLEIAPHAKLATHAFSALRMATLWPVPLDRVHALAPGDRLDLGDRNLIALRPPTFDNPMTTAAFDDRTNTLFSVDAFGALLPGTAETVDDLDAGDLATGMITWTTFDSPWTHITDLHAFHRTLDEVTRLEPKRIMSGHLPAAVGRIDEFLELVASVPDAEPFVPPDAAAFNAILAGIGRAEK
jgi:hypothetical protein